MGFWQINLTNLDLNYLTIESTSYARRQQCIGTAVIMLTADVSGPVAPMRV